MSNNSVKPLEFVVSAIHCLREKKGSSPQNILRFLAGKYNVDAEVLKPYVRTGLRRGVSFGLITLQSGLYRLNDILSAPLDTPGSNKEKTPRLKYTKTGGVLKKGRPAQSSGKKRRRLFRTAHSTLNRNKRRTKPRQDRRKKRGFSARRHYNEKRRKQKQPPKAKSKKRVKPKNEKLIKHVKAESPQIKPEGPEDQNTENEKVEASKNVVKT